MEGIEGYIDFGGYNQDEWCVTKIENGVFNIYDESGKIIKIVEIDKNSFDLYRVGLKGSYGVYYVDSQGVIFVEEEGDLCVFYRYSSLSESQESQSKRKDYEDRYREFEDYEIHDILTQIIY